MSNYRSGRVSYNGNGMIGGSWWAADAMGHCDIETADIIEKVSDLIATHLPQEFRVEASFDIGSDPTVGMPDYCNFNEQMDPDEAYEAIEKAEISRSWKTALRAVVDAYLEDLDEYDYELEEE